MLFRSRPLAHVAKTLVVTEEFDRVSRHRLNVTHLGEIAADAMIDYLGHSTSAGGYGHYFTGHCLERGQTELLEFTGEQHDIGNRQLFVDLVLLAQEEDIVMNALLYGEPLRNRAVGAVANE